ncbi:hypothetical protein [Pseudanabaena sp. UWO310]|uniref:hypothetical protein n=1 Tax=Pseudanabaena sp. UWO310 TaxID=2480795 RepID=UPI001158E04D|nr:hypothetical protein [Pseudanabaena sp. UWO310]TYQ30936.1 hypothetical protein PseudUWO310_06220 [Pseudanabaena sp. UWO310]
MRKLIFVALAAIIPNLIPSEAFAQLSLTCSSTGSLALSGKYTFVTATPAQCSLEVDNTVSSIGVTISLSNAVLTSISGSAKTNPSGTTTTAQLTYSNSGNKSVSQNASITDTFSGSTTTPMAISMQSTRPNKFFAGTYMYGVTINITSP